MYWSTIVCFNIKVWPWRELSLLVMKQVKCKQARWRQSYEVYRKLRNWVVVSSNLNLFNFDFHLLHLYNLNTLFSWRQSCTQDRALAGCQLVIHSSTHKYTRALLTMWKHAKTLEELRQVFDISQLWNAFHTAAVLNVPAFKMAWRWHITK